MSEISPPRMLRFRYIHRRDFGHLHCLSLPACFTYITWSLKRLAEDKIDQMVLGYNGHRHCVDPTSQSPHNGSWLSWISVVLFALNVALFSIFLVISILRYSVYPEIWSAMIRHAAQSLFLGTFPMGLATIINMIVFVCVPAWGAWAIYLVSARSLC